MIAGWRTCARLALHLVILAPVKNPPHWLGPSCHFQWHFCSFGHQVIPYLYITYSSLSNVFWNMWKTILFKTFDKVLLDVNSSTMCWEHKFREKRRKFFEEGGRMSELKALLVSERVFSLEDQRSAQACCYRNFSEYNEETLNNLLFMSDCHLYIAIPKWEVVKENHQSQFD